MKPSIVAYIVVFHWWLQAWIEILDGGFHDFSKLHTPKLWEMKNPPTRNEVHLPGSPVFQNCAAKKHKVQKPWESNQFRPTTIFIGWLVNHHYFIVKIIIIIKKDFKNV